MSMTYIEIAPSSVLRPLLRSLWYCRALDLRHSHERVLPNGCIQVVLNLTGADLHNCGGALSAPLAPSLVVGASARYQLIDTADLTELAGMVFEPGGFSRLFRERADLFFEQSIDLRSVWPRTAFIERLSGASDPMTKLRVLDNLLKERAERAKAGSAVVDETIRLLTGPATSVSECARSAGRSERWLSQLFREEVGVAPKLWCRIQRFQAAVSDLHRGADVPWAELALRCGYYDQAHFINDFHSFSGVNPTTYSTQTRVWQNHLPVD